jgi:arylsulfatase A-like enzyme
MPSRIVSLAAALAVFTAWPAVAAAAQAQPPNILFIFSDDHAYQAVSAYGDPRRLIQTPNLDRLAAEGVRFNHCLVTNSLCGPSRATVLTGKYNHLNGFYNNYNCRFDGSQTTLPKLLQAAGYQTAIVGKWHLVSDPTGFDSWEVLPGQGDYYNPEMIRNGTRIHCPGYVTDIITQRTLDWLEHRDKSKPFLMMCQHKAPHREWEPALKYLDHDGDRVYDAPATLFDDYAGRGKAEHVQDMMIGKTLTRKDLKLTPPPRLTPEQLAVWNAYYEPRNEAFRKANRAGADLVRWKYNRYLHDYLGCIKSIDESVGRLLKFLDDEHLADNTLVVYSSDQGFFLGEHGWFDKRWIFAESLHAPLLVRWPRVARAGVVNEDIVSNLDFAETLLEAAGLPVPAEMQGRSFMPLLKGQTPADWRKAFYYHYYEHPAVHNVARHYGVVTARYKLVHFYEPEFNYWELFDLEKDPCELRSVYGEADYAAVQAELAGELARLRRELKVPEQDPPETFIRAARAKPTAKKPAA